MPRTVRDFHIVWRVVTPYVFIICAQLLMMIWQFCTVGWRDMDHIALPLWAHQVGTFGHTDCSQLSPDICWFLHPMKNWTVQPKYGRDTQHSCDRFPVRGVNVKSFIRLFYYALLHYGNKIGIIYHIVFEPLITFIVLNFKVYHSSWLGVKLRGTFTFYSSNVAKRLKRQCKT